MGRNKYSFRVLVVTVAPVTNSPAAATAVENFGFGGGSLDGKTLAMTLEVDATHVENSFSGNGTRTSVSVDARIKSGHVDGPRVVVWAGPALLVPTME